MKLITRNTDYALRALCYIAKQNELKVTVDELVNQLDVPRPFMRKILQLLSRKGVLKSFQGQGGGFKLRIPARKLYLIKIRNIFQSEIGLSGCFLKKDICPNKGKCVLRNKINSIEEEVLKQLKAINIASLIGRR
jgi:Rrf2 family protein